MSEASKRRRARKKQRIKNKQLKSKLQWRRFLRGKGPRPR